MRQHEMFYFSRIEYFRPRKSAHLARKVSYLCDRGNIRAFASKIKFFKKRFSRKKFLKINYDRGSIRAFASKNKLKKNSLQVKNI